MMDELSTHHARFSRHNKPSRLSRYAVRRRVADDIHLGMMAADFHARATLHPHGVTQADVAAAQLAPTPRSPVVAVHQDDVARRVDQQRPELPTRTITGLRQS